MTGQNTRKITADEVREWFERHRQPWPDTALCRDVAGKVTKMWWPGDPVPDLNIIILRHHEEEVRKQPWAADPQKVEQFMNALRETLKEEAESNPWWNFKGATDAARTLLDALPAMLSFQEQLRWAPETRDGLEAVRALGDALSRAMPYIEWPFGKYEPVYRTQRKDWHIPAVIIRNLVREALIHSGHIKPAISRNSITVAIVREALDRMGYPTVTKSAIAMHLERWAAKYETTTN